jgi:hypothetical protein
VVHTFTAYELLKYNSSLNVKNYALLLVTLAACGQQAVLLVRGPVTGVRLWPDPSVPDWNPSNDTWGNPPPANPAGPVTRK